MLFGNFLPRTIDRANSCVAEAYRLRRQTAGEHPVRMMCFHERLPALPDRREIGVIRHAEHMPGVSLASDSLPCLDTGKGRLADAEDLRHPAQEPLLRLVIGAIGERDVEQALEH